MVSDLINDLPDGIHHKSRVLRHDQVGAFVSDDVPSPGYSLNEAFMQVELNVARRIGDVTSRRQG